MRKPISILGLATLATLAVATSAHATPSATPSTATPGAATAAATSASASPRTASASATPSASAKPSASASPTATPTRSASAVATDPTQAAAQSAMDAVAARLSLGSPLDDMAAFAGGYVRHYTGYTMYWSATTGAHAISSLLDGKYSQTGRAQSSLGFPVSNSYDAGSGVQVADFEHGQIVYSAATGVHAVYGAVGGVYSSLGSTTSFLGLPTTDEQDGGVAGSRVNRFTSGTIDWSPATGPHAVYGAIGSKYAQLNYESSSLGLPLTNEYNTPSGGRRNDFQSGVIIWSATTHEHAVYGAIYKDYASLGQDASSLGKPISDEYNTPSGGRRNDFESGVIIWSPSTHEHAVYGAIYKDYASLGQDASSLGKPISDEYNTPSGGRRNDFESGVIIWSPSTHEHAVYGAIYKDYASLGQDASSLGKPISDEYNTPSGGRRNDFESGVIIWSATTHEHAVFGSIFQEYSALNQDSGTLGKPTSDEYQGANGARANTFENGMIVWKYATGAHAVTGVMLQEFAKRGYEGGSLGAPITDAYAVNGGQEQKFENGTLTYVNGSFSSTTTTQSTQTTTSTPTTTALQSSPNAVGNFYYWGSCVYWAYERRIQLGAPVSSYWGSGGAWASAARADGYTVDHKPQVGAVISTYGYGADPVYGHAMVVESINADGSFTVSQMNAPVAGQVTYRTFTAADAANLWFIH